MARLLDLFCGAGGAAEGYRRAGFEVVGVDIQPQPRYPFEVYREDALTFPLDGFDVVHASPPCQRFTAYRRRPGVAETAPDVIAYMRRRLGASGLPYVIENVELAPLVYPIRLCGSSFRLDVRRHRCFESNVKLSALPCEHSWQTPRFPAASNRTNLRRTVEIGVWRIPLSVQRQAMGIDWMNVAELSEAVPPAYTEFLGQQLLAVL